MTTAVRIPRIMFWRAASTSGLGEPTQGVVDVALPVIAVGALGATGWQASAVTAAESVGLVLFGLLAGVFADRHNRVSIITTANLLRAVAFFALPIGRLFHIVSIPTLVLLGVIAGACGVFADMARVLDEAFGPCSVYGECVPACPAGIPLEAIARVNREVLRTGLIGRGRDD